MRGLIIGMLLSIGKRRREMKKILSLVIVAGALGFLFCPSVSADPTDRSMEWVQNRVFKNATITDGRDTVASAATAEAMASSSTRYGTITICAETNNTGVMTVGGSTVVASLATRRGIPLTAGACWTNQSTGDLSDIYLDTTVSGDGVTYAYTN